MDYNFTSEEYDIVTNKTFHLMENVSLDELDNINVSIPAPSAEIIMFYVFT